MRLQTYADHPVRLRRRGYAAKGEQTQTKDYYWHKGPSYMLYAVVDCTRLVAFMLVEGSCDADSVIIFIQHLVVRRHHLLLHFSARFCLY